MFQNAFFMYILQSIHEKGARLYLYIYYVYIIATNNLDIDLAFVFVLYTTYK